jgi:hypothetical protein
MSVYAYTKMITCNLKRLYFIHLKLKIYLNDVWTSFQICFTKYYFSRRTCKLSHCMRCRLEVSGSFAYATGEKISCMQAEQWTSMNVHVPSSNTPIRTREQRSQKGKQKLLLRYLRAWTAAQERKAEDARDAARTCTCRSPCSKRCFEYEGLV